MRRWILAGILLAALALRLHDLGLDPWYDEILTLQRCAALDLRALASSYESQNHHVLYSLLAKLAMDGLGNTIAAARLPAVLFGVGGLAATYALGRQIASPSEGLLAAALLAVSYHHVWFSQNARGYTALACFVVLITLLLRRALTRGRMRDWLGYGAIAALAAYTHLTMLLVVAAQSLTVAHKLLGGARGASPSARGIHRTRLLGALLGFGLCAGLVALLYAPMLRGLVTVNRTEGRDAVVEWARPLWTLGQLAAGLATGFSGSGFAALVVVLAAAGLFRLTRREPLVGELFVLPVAASAGVLIASGHHLWPRFFFFAIGLGAIALISGCFAAGDLAQCVWPRLRLRGETLGSIAAGLLIVASAASLPPVYAPKQRFREALEMVQRERAPGDRVAAFGDAAPVFKQYYGAPWESVSSAEELAALRPAAGRRWLVVMFPIAVRQGAPDVQAALDAEFDLVGGFDGTVRDGALQVWRSAPSERRSDATSAAR